ncbi:MAG: nitroreductase family deazaflavin-dependent oxidoreductase [Actinomycetota bacterium]|nr:nitroreductase family deazaflavin-dependent oxidoreductase [Actinomycetota bacterium]
MSEITDSPTDWVAEHTARYLATDGEDGYLFYGYPTLLLTTTGRKSGQLRRTPLHFGRHGDAYLLVASSGGSATHPAWYLNLLADPTAHLQIKAEEVNVRARTATAVEKPPLWEIMVSVFPRYTEYQAQVDREIPVVVLERV